MEAARIIERDENLQPRYSVGECAVIVGEKIPYGIIGFTEFEFMLKSLLPAGNPKNIMVSINAVEFIKSIGPQCYLCSNRGTVMCPLYRIG